MLLIYAPSIHLRLGLPLLLPITYNVKTFWDSLSSFIIGSFTYHLCASKLACPFHWTFLPFPYTYCMKSVFLIPVTKEKWFISWAFCERSLKQDKFRNLLFKHTTKFGAVYAIPSCWKTKYWSFTENLIFGSIFANKLDNILN